MKNRARNSSTNPSKRWFDYRAGRITSSKVFKKKKEICSTSIKSLLSVQLSQFVNKINFHLWLLPMEISMSILYWHQTKFPSQSLSNAMWFIYFERIFFYGCQSRCCSALRLVSKTGFRSEMPLQLLI